MLNCRTLFGLPVELLLEILHLIRTTSHPYVDIIKVSHVNSRLRSIAISCPALWRFIYIDHTKRSLKLARLSFSRSKSSKLNIHVVIDDDRCFDHFQEAFALLQSTYPSEVQAYTLEIGCSGYGPPPVYGPPPAYGLELINTAHLEELEITYEDGMEPLVKQFTLPFLPHLRRFTFIGPVPSAPKGTSFESVRYVRLCGTGDIPWISEDFYKLLRGFPNVEEIEVEMIDHDINSSQPILLLNLRRISFSVHPHDLSQVLQHIEAPLLHAVTFTSACCTWTSDMSREAICTSRHTSVRLLEFQEYCLDFPCENTAYSLPQILPNLETIILDFAAEEIVTLAVHHATAEGRASLWDTLKRIIITGKPHFPKPEYIMMIDSLNEFASGRNKLVRAGGDVPSPLSIVFQFPFDWEEVAKEPMEALAQEVAEIQVGETVIGGALGQVGVEE